MASLACIAFSPGDGGGGDTGSGEVEEFTGQHASM